MTTPAQPLALAIAQNRFGLGARPSDAISAEPKQWLNDQLDRFQPAPAAAADLRRTPDIIAEYSEDRAGLRDLSDADRMEARKKMRQAGRKLYQDEVNQRALSAATTDTPFVERLVHFWSNHFAVSVEKPQVTVLAGAFEREAIRPNVLGRFENMVLAVEQHPAMLFFLDQVRATGPNSVRAQRAQENNAARKPGFNENLAREIMELHTLGVRTGYSQQDVTEFAKAMTGWTVGGIGGGAQQDEPGTFLFRPGMHEPGSRTIMGKSYSQKGERQAEAIIRDLTASEATATHIATKLARHFAADDPPAEMIAALKQAFVQSRGDLPTVYRALIDAPQVWEADARKFKTPWEWTVSALRALGPHELDGLNVAQLTNQLGQPVWRPGSPAGYDDVAASWAAPDALVRRVETAQRLARMADSSTDARTLAGEVLGSALSDASRTQIERAESPQTALALLLVAPEFQRR